MKKWIAKGIKQIADLLYPIKCPFCGEIVSAGREKRTAHNGICASCRKKIVYIGEPRCKKCGKPISKAEEEFCYDCTRKQRLFEEGRSLWLHKEPVKQAVYALKYKNRRIYAEAFGAELAEHYGRYLRRKRVDRIVPIPLHKKRRRERGFNQAELLADELGKRTGIPVDAAALRRVKETRPQKKLDDKGRSRNMRGAFEASGEITGKTIVLIDDIYTTGSTLSEAAGTLYRAGAEKVYFLTISIGQGI